MEDPEFDTDTVTPEHALQQMKAVDKSGETPYNLILQRDAQVEGFREIAAQSVNLYSAKQDIESWQSHVEIAKTMVQEVQAPSITKIHSMCVDAIKQFVWADDGCLHLPGERLGQQLATILAQNPAAKGLATASIAGALRMNLPTQVLDALPQAAVRSKDAHVIIDALRKMHEADNDLVLRKIAERQSMIDAMAKSTWSSCSQSAQVQSRAEAQAAKPDLPATLAVTRLSDQYFKEVAPMAARGKQCHVQTFDDNTQGKHAYQDAIRRFVAANPDPRATPIDAAFPMTPGTAPHICVHDQSGLSRRLDEVRSRITTRMVSATSDNNRIAGGRQVSTDGNGDAQVLMTTHQPEQYEYAESDAPPGQAREDSPDPIELAPARDDTRVPEFTPLASEPPPPVAGPSDKTDAPEKENDQLPTLSSDSEPIEQQVERREPTPEPPWAEVEADVDGATDRVEEQLVTMSTSSHVDTQLETSFDDLLNEFPTSNPFERLTQDKEASTVNAALDSADEPPVQLAHNVVPQGKKRSKAFTLRPKQPQPEPEPPPAWQFSNDGRLFKHQAQILHPAPDDIRTAGAHAEVTVVIDSGSEVIAIEAAVFKQWQVTLQLELSRKA
ncbi:hypothetical protein OIO90_006426 [Microbotryomycetes sp. JL221]|nr:hypothetical protein OIO90_006426 [Microbotryomycetes sp. JL221]